MSKYFRTGDWVVDKSAVYAAQYSFKAASQSFDGEGDLKLSPATTRCTIHIDDGANAITLEGNLAAQVWNGMQEEFPHLSGLGNCAIDRSKVVRCEISENPTFILRLSGDRFHRIHLAGAVPDQIVKLFLEEPEIDIRIV